MRMISETTHDLLQHLYVLSTKTSSFLQSDHVRVITIIDGPSIEVIDGKSSIR